VSELFTHPEAPPVPRPPTHRWRPAVFGALVGGLCGALVASGALVLLDDDGDTTRVVGTGQGTTEIDRESSTIAEEGDVASIIALVQPAVVAITVEVDAPTGEPDEGAGTGFIVSEDGFIVTNNHVVAGAESIEVAFADDVTIDADVVGRDAPADLAVLKVEASGLPVVEIGDSDAVQVGDDVIAIGNALALEGGLTVTRGIISGPPREIPTEIGTILESVLQTDAAINRGNSGGPLVDAAGRVIGINTAIADPAFAQNVGFAIPISLAQPIIEDLKAGRKPAFLGVATDTATDGAVVTDVTDGSPAEEAGIEEGDIIVEIGGTPIAGPSDVPAAIREHDPGDEVDVVLRRDGEELTVQASLVERPDSG